MRKPRLLQEGAKYHVTARANRQEMIFDSDAMKALFEDVVARAKKKFSFRVDNFCVMGNHFHLIVQPAKNVSLSSIMQWIMSVFAQAWNRFHGLSGHVWGQRFFSRILQTAESFVQTFQYIDTNPVRAGLVVVAEEWAFGGCFHRAKGRKDIVDEKAEP